MQTTRHDFGTGYLVCQPFERNSARYGSVGLVDPATMSADREGTLRRLVVPEALAEKFVTLGYTVLEQPAQPKRPPLPIGSEHILGRGRLFHIDNRGLGLHPHLEQEIHWLEAWVVHDGWWHKVTLWAHYEEDSEPDFRLNDANLERLEAALGILGIKTPIPYRKMERVLMSQVWRNAHLKYADSDQIKAAYYVGRRYGLTPEQSARLVLDRLPGYTDEKEGALSEIEEPIDDPVPPRRYYKRPGP